LCVPLFYNDQIIGVLELLDKDGAAHFTPADMEALGLFANLSAIAIAQSRTQENLSSLLLDSLADSAALDTEERERLERGAQSLVGRLTEDAAFGQRLELAQLVQEIAGQGEAEFAACRSVLRGFADYLRARPTLGTS
ncbi:MAG: GAF domain-containing protein, partial [Armatimonadota bacterium]|nr:GAF domain-containing protein [Armatimonadota bacterium]